MKKIEVSFHGELIIMHTEGGEVIGKPEEHKADAVLADSEATGNDHMLQVIPGVHIFHDLENDIREIEAKVDTKIYCKLENRHTDLVLKGGSVSYIVPAQEYDYLEQEIRNVRD